MQTGRLRRIPQTDSSLEESKHPLEKSLRLSKARVAVTSRHKPHASDFPAKGRTRLLSRIVLTENSEFPHTVTGRGKGHHRKAVSLIEEEKGEVLFVKVKRHRRLSSGGMIPRTGDSTKHRRSASNKDRKRLEEDSASSQLPPYPIDHNRHKSLTLDLDSLETEYHEEALSNCSTKKIIAKPVTSLSPDLKLVAYIQRFCRVYNRSPPSSLCFYHLGGLVGKGAFSCVYSAHSRLTGVAVALKSVEKTVLTDPRRSRKLTQEIEIMRHTRHPNLVKLYDLIETPSHFHLVLEFLSGGSLLSLVQTQGKLTEKTAKTVFLAVAQGLKALHDSGVVHRDVKLDNILLADGIAKLADFGVSKCVRPAERLLDTVGTPSYLAPETLTEKDYDGQPADVWSLGVSLYGLLCGTLPFKGFNFATLHKCISNCVYSLPSDLSRPAKDLLTRLLAADPTRRITIAEALQHPWLKEVRLPTAAENVAVNAAILTETSKLGFPSDLILETIKTREVTLASATYEMLRDRS